MGKTIVMILAILFLCLGTFVLFDPNVSFRNIRNSNVITVIQQGNIACSISGEVEHPGNYVLKKNSTLQDLIEKAGGVTEKADTQAFLLSCSLEDGKSYYIAPKVTTTEICEPTEIIKVNINKADQEELMSVQGIGSAIAKAIIDYRETNGYFQCLEDLLKVPGIGNATFERIKNYICLS